MGSGLAIFRAMLGFMFLALFGLLMYGLKSGLTFMGEEFALGFGAGFVCLGALLLLHRKVTGRDIFTC